MVFTVCTIFQRVSLAARGRSALVLTVAAAGLACLGCGQKAETLLPSQVAARVNDSDVTVHQVQSVLQRQPRLVADEPEQAARRVLDALVEQEIAAQAARQQGLDKDPAVLQSLEAMRREVLARAYQDRVASSARGPNSDEIDRFYESQPALFAQRRIFVLQDFQIAAPADVEAVRVIARGVTSGPKEIDERLAAGGFKYRSRIQAQAAEDLPLSLLQQLAPLSAGQSLVIPLPRGARLLHVLHMQSAPVERRNAAEAIGTYLASDQRRLAVQAAMKSFRETAKVEYLGVFATAPASAPVPAASAPAR
jgi:EpsD family peptidyl-prolyl cis-trans isomerase